MKTKHIGEVGVFEQNLQRSLMIIDFLPDEEASCFEGFRASLVSLVEGSRDLYFNGLNPNRKKEEV